MKKKCKNVDIENRRLIRGAVFSCLAPLKKRLRDDTCTLFASLLKVDKDEAATALFIKEDEYKRGVGLVADMLQEMIHTRNLRLKPVKQEERKDKSNGKVRIISILHIEQLLLDHVVVHAISDLTKRIGEYQVSSIPKRRSCLWKESNRMLASQKIQQIRRKS